MVCFSLLFARKRASRLIQVNIYIHIFRHFSLKSGRHAVIKSVPGLWNSQKGLRSVHKRKSGGLHLEIGCRTSWIGEALWVSRMVIHASSHTYIRVHISEWHAAELWHCAQHSCCSHQYTQAALPFLDPSRQPVKLVSWLLVHWVFTATENGVASMGLYLCSQRNLRAATLNLYSKFFTKLCRLPVGSFVAITIFTGLNLKFGPPSSV